jgi:DNA-binding GntR family transcriptional regulator
VILSASTLEKLRDAILRLELAPGATLTERGLEPLLDASRTTVRGALLKLEAEGLVVKSGRGYSVAPIDLSEITQACDWREVIEISAAKLSVQKSNPAQLEALQTKLSAANPLEPLQSYLRDATDFHVQLAKLSGNAFMVRALEDVLVRLARARSFEAGTEAGRTRANTEHNRILEMVIAGNSTQVELELKAHLERSRNRVLTSLLESGGLQVRVINNV